MRQVYTSMRPELKIYINLLTGEMVTKLNHARAFVYFYAKADKDNKPQGKDIIELKRNEKIKFL